MKLEDQTSVRSAHVPTHRQGSARDDINETVEAPSADAPARPFDLGTILTEAQGARAPPMSARSSAQLVPCRGRMAIPALPSRRRRRRLVLSSVHHLRGRGRGRGRGRFRRRRRRGMNTNGHGYYGRRRAAARVQVASPGSGAGEKAAPRPPRSSAKRRRATRSFRATSVRSFRASQH